MVAAILAAQLRTVRTALLQGTTVVVPLVRRLEGRVFADQSVRREVKRQKQRFRVTCWSPDPDSRDRVAVAIDTTLAATTFLALPDGSSGRLRFAASEVTDRSESAALFRRDLIYTVEYPRSLQRTSHGWSWEKFSFRRLAPTPLRTAWSDRGILQ